MPTPADLLAPIPPGTKPGFTRPVAAPNNGALGGRPTGSGVSQAGTTAAPMETLPGSLPVAPMPPGAAMPTTTVQPGAPVPVATAPAPAAPAPVPAATTAAPTTPAATAVPPNAEAMPVPAAPAPAAAAPVPHPMLTPIVPPPVQFATVPKNADMGTVPEGSEIQTPLGVGRKVNGRLADGFQLNAAGKEAYTHAKVARLTAFGDHPFKGDPNAPMPPVEPGQLAYNPFATPGNEWSK